MNQSPKVLLFDVNETLLDLTPLRSSIGQLLEGRADLLPFWFTTMLHYSLVETLAGNYKNFGEIGAAALVMVAQANGISLEQERAAEVLIESLRSLPPHSDVVPALMAFQKAGFRIISLTNSSYAGVSKQFKNAELGHYFEKWYSVETVKKFKPHPAPYEYVLQDLQLLPDELVMIAAHPWDLMGAKKVGLSTAFIQRPGKTRYPNAPSPDYVATDLLDLVQQLNMPK